MQPNSSPVRSAVPPRILWMWTGVSALLHTIFIGGLCVVSHLDAQKRDATAKAKAAETTPQPDPAPDAAAPSPTPAAPNSQTAPTPPNTPQPAANPAASATAVTTPAAQPQKSATPPSPTADKPAPPSAEKILGIDKVAKPDDAPKSANPFSKKDDDLLKDLK